MRRVHQPDHGVVDCVDADVIEKEEWPRTGRRQVVHGEVHQVAAEHLVALVLQAEQHLCAHAVGARDQ